MGAKASKPQTKTDVSKKKDIAQIVDYVARNFILTANFQDMKNLTDTGKCNDLVILTSKIIADKLNDKEIQYLSDRIEDGVSKKIVTKEKVIFLKKKNLNKLDVKNETEKRRMCIGIAKFYVRIAHIFSAIVMTVNPIFVYEKEDGQREKVNLMNLKNIPDGIDKVTKIYKPENNICSDRINNLLNGNNYETIEKDTMIKVKPNFCSVNWNQEKERNKVLQDEPGIPHLEELYNNLYNLEDGKFGTMSEKMRKGKYKEDLEQFYKVFTGEDKIPVDSSGEPLVKSFKDIKLKNYHSGLGCKRELYAKETPLYKREYSGKKTGLFKKYADHVKNMMKSSESNRNKLIEIIDSLFIYGKNDTGKKGEEYTIILNPELTEEKLEELTDKTRNIIVSLYLTCESDFAKGVDIFEAIVEKNELDNNRVYLDSLKTDLDKKVMEKQIEVENKEKKIVKEQELRSAEINEAIAQKIKSKLEKDSESAVEGDGSEMLRGQKLELVEKVKKTAEEKTQERKDIESKPVEKFQLDKESDNFAEPETTKEIIQDKMKEQNPSLEENKRDESGDIGDKDKPNNAPDVPDPVAVAVSPVVPVASDDENPIKAEATEQKPEPESLLLKAPVAEEVTTSAPEIFEPAKEPSKEPAKELSSE